MLTLDDAELLSLEDWLRLPDAEQQAITEAYAGPVRKLPKSNGTKPKRSNNENLSAVRSDERGNSGAIHEA